ncbi:MAG: DUF4276 family protein [Gammaproteobacteria bacterium]|nr:DUF4276 family protein [Gammaproteobacteria bacterium]
MTKIIIVCEGQTEEAFVNNILRQHFTHQDIFVQPRLIATSQRAKGGALSRQRVLRFLRNTLLERRNTYVTTFFDLYALRSDFPGRSEAAIHSDPIERATAIEVKFQETVLEEAKCLPGRFLPHIQPYEFESLLFSDIGRFSEAESAWQPFISQLEAARQSAATPEHINDGFETHPSARLQSLLRPRYNKVRHGVVVSGRIGLDRIRAECTHFDKWIARMEALPPL